jgi:hypothetical protein
MTLVFVVLLALAGCSLGAPGAAVSGQAPGGGASKPEEVVQSFFEDLRDALKDPALENDERRGQIAEQLANYFAPNERDDQRVALRDALDSFVHGLGRLDPSERLTLEVRFEHFQKLSEDDDHALIRPVNGSIYVLISRTTNSGVVTIYEDSVGFDKILGREDGAVPVVRIGRSWFLTEG